MCTLVGKGLCRSAQCIRCWTPRKAHCIPSSFRRRSCSQLRTQTAAPRYTSNWHYINRSLRTMRRWVRWCWGLVHLLKSWFLCRRVCLLNELLQNLRCTNSFQAGYLLLSCNWRNSTRSLWLSESQVTTVTWLLPRHCTSVVHKSSQWTNKAPYPSPASALNSRTLVHELFHGCTRSTLYFNFQASRCCLVELDLVWGAQPQAYLLSLWHKEPP